MYTICHGDVNDDLTRLNLTWTDLLWTGSDMTNARIRISLDWVRTGSYQFFYSKLTHSVACVRVCVCVYMFYLFLIFLNKLDNINSILLELHEF